MGTNSDPDADLVERAIAGLPRDSRAYAILMRRYHRLMLRICSKMLNSPDDAEDVVQEVMLKVFHALPGFEGRASFKTWLSRITTNTCINAYDKLKRANEMKTILGEDPHVVRTTHISTAKRDVGRAMQRLDLRDRQILTLRYVSDLKIDEIADICDLSLSAAKMRLYRAQETLQALMNESR